MMPRHRLSASPGISCNGLRRRPAASPHHRRSRRCHQRQRTRGASPRRSPLASAHRRRAAPTPRCTARWSGSSASTPPSRTSRQKQCASTAMLLTGTILIEGAGDTTSAAGGVSSAAGRGRGSRAVNSPAPRVEWRQPGLFVSRARITERRFKNHKVSQPRRYRIILLSLDTRDRSPRAAAPERSLCRPCTSAVFVSIGAARDVQPRTAARLLSYC